MNTVLSFKLNKYNTYYEFELSETETSLEISRTSIENGTHHTETTNLKTNLELNHYFENITTPNSTLWSLLLSIGVKKSSQYTLQITPDFTVSPELLQVIFKHSTVTLFDILPFFKPASNTLKTRGESIPIKNSIAVTGDDNSGAISTVLDAIARFYSSCPDGLVLIPWTNETYSPLNKVSISKNIPGSLIPPEKLQTKKLSSQRIVYTPIPYESERIMPYIERSLPTDRPVLMVIDMMMVHDTIEKIRGLTRKANNSDNITTIVHNADIKKVVSSSIDFDTYIAFTQSSDVPSEIKTDTPNFNHSYSTSDSTPLTLSTTPKPYDSQYDLQEYQPARVSTDAENWVVEKFPAGCIPTSLTKGEIEYVPDGFEWSWSEIE